MPDNLHLVTELAIILIAAGVFTIISKALKQPLILGYIVAGFLIGPNLGLFPQFGAASIKEWSELGIIFLMFGLGLEFSLKKMLKIGSSALITAGTQCMGMFGIGMLVGQALGWSTMESIFLGGMLGMSSTAIILKAYDDMGLMKKPHAPLVFGALVFEDLIAVILMVLLTTLATTGKFEGRGMVEGLVKLVFFLFLWFLIGLYLIPLALKKAKSYLSDEILLLVGIGLCFLMVVLANLAGFSSALGAFVMGSILAETVEGERIAGLTLNIKNLFAAIFFVSVGMMVNPVVIAEHWAVILIIAAVAVCGILLFSTTGALLAGQGLDSAVHTGCTMAQIGEFSFIIAGLGCSMGVVSDFIYPVIISVSVLTTFTTPYMIKLGDPMSRWLHRVLPASVIARLSPSDRANTRSSAEKNEWRTLIKHYCLRIAAYYILIVSFVILCNKLLPRLSAVAFINSLSSGLKNWLDLLVTLAVISPFIFGMAINGKEYNKSASLLVQKNPVNRWPILALNIFKAALLTMAIIEVIGSHFHPVWWELLILVALTIVLLCLLTGYSTKQISPIEETFFANFNEKEALARKNAPVASKINEILRGYDVHIQIVDVSPDFTYAGKTLREMPFRRTTGVNIIKIIRGTRSIIIPSGNEPVFPSDRLVAVGTTEQLERFAETIAANVEHYDNSESEFTVKTIVLDDSSRLSGSTLREADMRASGCMAVCVLRGEQFITNPSADLRLQPGDTVWLAGDSASIDWYR